MALGRRLGGGVCGGLRWPQRPARCSTPCAACQQGAGGLEAPISAKPIASGWPSMALGLAISPPGPIPGGLASMPSGCCPCACVFRGAKRLRSQEARGAALRPGRGTPGGPVAAGFAGVLISSGPSYRCTRKGRVVRRKRECQHPPTLAMDQSARDQAMAVYSAGNSGAVMAAAIFPACGRLKGNRSPGESAPCFPTTRPRRAGCWCWMSAPTWIASRPNLHQFGCWGSIYSRDVLGVATQDFGLLNIGAKSPVARAMTSRSRPIAAGGRESASLCRQREGRDVLSRPVRCGRL